MYEIVVSDNTATSINNHLCGTWCDHNTTYYSPTYTYWYPQTKYLYQIFCPKKGCNTPNWLEIDEIKECSKCDSTLKAVKAKVDYEIEVGG